MSDVTLWINLRVYYIWGEILIANKVKSLFESSKNMGKRSETLDFFKLNLVFFYQNWQKVEYKYFINSKLKILTSWQMVTYSVCLSNLCCFSLRRASKIFVISSDCLLTPAQQVHDPPCLGLLSKKGETKQKNPIKEHLRYSMLITYCFWGIEEKCLRTGLNCQIQVRRNSAYLSACLSYQGLWVKSVPVLSQRYEWSWDRWRI